MKNKNTIKKSSNRLLLSTILALTVVPKTNAAILNGDFEIGDFSGWTTIGDASIQTGGVSNNNGDANDFNEIAPFAGAYHALITTACVDTSMISGGFCDNSPSGRSGQDDGVTPAGRFEFSDQGAVNATTESELMGDAYALQTFLGLSDTALDNAGTDTLGNRQIKEGSGFKQTFTLTEATTVGFRWAFLSNDFDEIVNGNNDDGFGGRDFGFYTLYDNSTPIGSRTINVLQESDVETFDVINDFPSDIFPGGASTVNFRYKINYTQASIQLTPGTYTIGFGVVDGVGNDYTSALLVDNFQVEVPESSTLLGILGLGLGFLFIPKSKIKK